MFKCVKEQNGLSALLFPSKGRQESGEEFWPLICLSTLLCIFLTRLASLENNPVANQANIFLFAAAPTCMGWQGASPTAACPVPAVGSGCGRLRYLCPAGQVPPADSWHALTHALTEKKMKEAVTTFFFVRFSSFFKQVMLTSQNYPKEGWVNSFLQNNLEMDTISFLGNYPGGQAWAENDQGKVYDSCEYFCYFHKLVMTLCGKKQWWRVTSEEKMLSSHSSSSTDLPRTNRFLLKYTKK